MRIVSVHTGRRWHGHERSRAAARQPRRIAAAITHPDPDLIPTAGRATNEEGGDRMASEAGAEPPVAGRVGGSDGRRPLRWRDVRGDTRRRADELVCTESEAVALEALRAATGETDGDMSATRCASI